MWYIIGGFIVVCIALTILEWLFELVGGVFVLLFKLVGGALAWLAEFFGGAGRLIFILIILGAIFYVSSWYGICLAAIVYAIGHAIVSVLGKAGKYIGSQVEQHDKRKREVAEIKKRTIEEKQIHDNDSLLMEELTKNCYWLGYMDDDKWLKKLPNYANKHYSSDFKTITNNFAQQIEQQHILQNDDWFEPYKIYVLNHPGGSTVTKMLHEVNCPQLRLTHSTPDGDLVNTWLVRGTKKENKDVPALFASTYIKEMNESIFTPTPYLQKLYSNNTVNAEEDEHVTEISFDDL